MEKTSKKKPKPRKSGAVAMAAAGLKQGVYWLTAEDHAILKQAAADRGQSVMSLVQHLIRVGARQMVEG